MAKPLPQHHELKYKPFSTLQQDADGYWILEAEENEQCGVPIFGAFCPQCRIPVWVQFPEGKDSGSLVHPCGNALKFVKAKQ